MSALDELGPGDTAGWEHGGVTVEVFGLGAEVGPVLFEMTQGMRLQTFTLSDVREIDGEETFIIEPEGRTVTDEMREAARYAGGRIEREGDSR